MRDYRTLIRAGFVPSPLRTPRMSGTPFRGVAPIVGTPHLNALHLGRDSIGYPPGRLSPGYLNSSGTPDPDSGLVSTYLRHVPMLSIPPKHSSADINIIDPYSACSQPAYIAQHMPHLTGAGLFDGIHDPLMERIAALEATTPLASTRLRRLSKRFQRD